MGVQFGVNTSRKKSFVNPHLIHDRFFRPLRGGKGAYYQGGVRGTAWVHGKGPHMIQTLEERFWVFKMAPTIVI